jgi:hypothetical protein
MNMGVEPIVLCRRRVNNAPVNQGVDDCWVPDFEKIEVYYYDSSRFMSYLWSPLKDDIGLKKLFKENKCDLVHAHSPETAYYAYKLGLPTIFDDWEYWLEHANYMREYPSQPLRTKLRHSSPRQIYHLALGYYKRKRNTAVVKKLIKQVPLIVTNSIIEQKYRELGAKDICWVPNVPTNYEKEYASAAKRKKMDKITTCYIGNITMDEKNLLRNTLGVRDLWNREEMGDLYVFEGKNYSPHLEVMRKVMECTFNLLFWRPLPVHRYYLQNKAFLASVVGVPTIISSSLEATINLLGDFALPVNCKEDIPKVIKNYDYSTKYAQNPAHIWEYYQPKIKKVYENALSGVEN